jgi:hypothetical protein
MKGRSSGIDARLDKTKPGGDSRETCLLYVLKRKRRRVLCGIRPRIDGLDVQKIMYRWMVGEKT